MDNNHKKLYSQIEGYRMAFSYRNIAEECKFISDVFYKHTGRDLKSVLELASGPADHAFHFANSGLTVAALDLSEDMISYINEHDVESKIKSYLADMSNFKCEEKYSLAIMMLDSFSYLLTDEMIQNHFNCVADSLDENGIYIIDMDHPGSFLDLDSGSSNSDGEIGVKWDIENEEQKVAMHWGAPGSFIDSATQLYDVKTVLEIYNKRDNSCQKIEDFAKVRIFTANEFKLHVKISGRFEIVEQFRLFELDKKFDCSIGGHRMISVLRKR